MENDDNPVVHKLAEKNAKRISMFKQTNLFKIYQNFMKFESFEVRRGVNMMTLEQHISSLRFEQDMEPETVKRIFYDFSQFLSSGTHDTVVRFLYLLPRHKGGLHIVGSGLFSCDPKVREYAFSCLTKIRETKVGKKYISQLNYVILSKFIHLSS